MPVHDWSRDPPAPFESFHATWILEIVRALNRQILPKGYRAFAERHLGVLQPDVTTCRDATAAATRRSQTAMPQGWKATALLEYEPLPKRYSARIENGDGRPVAFLELVSKSNKESGEARDTFVEHLSVHICDGLHLVLLDVLTAPRADLHAELMTHLHTHAKSKASNGGPLYVASYRNLGQSTEDELGQLEACVRRFDRDGRLPHTTLWLSEDRWVMLDLEKLYAETCVTMRIE